MTTRVVKGGADRLALHRLIDGWAMPFTITLTKGVIRSNEQNRLQRLWMSEVADQLGDMTAEEVRGYCKLRFGVPILRAENEAFCHRYDEIVKPLPYEKKLALMMEPFDFGVTRIMTTKQKTDYLDDVHRHFSERGVILTNPEDLKRAA